MLREPFSHRWATRVSTDTRISPRADS